MHRPDPRSAISDSPTQPGISRHIGSTSSRQNAMPSSTDSGRPRIVVERACTVPLLCIGAAPRRRRRSDHRAPAGRRPQGTDRWRASSSADCFSSIRIDQPGRSHEERGARAEGAGSVRWCGGEADNLLAATAGAAPDRLPRVTRARTRSSPQERVRREPRAVRLVSRAASFTERGPSLRHDRPELAGRTTAGARSPALPARGRHGPSARSWPEGRRRH